MRRDRLQLNPGWVQRVQPPTPKFTRPDYRFYLLICVVVGPPFEPCKRVFSIGLASPLTPRGGTGRCECGPCRLRRRAASALHRYCTPVTNAPLFPLFLMRLYRVLRGHSYGNRGFLEDRMMDIITGRAPPPARAESQRTYEVGVRSVSSSRDTPQECRRKFTPQPATVQHLNEGSLPLSTRSYGTWGPHSSHGLWGYSMGLSLVTLTVEPIIMT